MGAKPPSGGGPAPRLPAPPQPAQAGKKGTDKRRRVGQSRNRTQLTGGLGGQFSAGATGEKKGLLGE